MYKNSKKIKRAYFFDIKKISVEYFSYSEKLLDGILKLYPIRDGPVYDKFLEKAYVIKEKTTFF